LEQDVSLSSAIETTDSREIADQSGRAILVPADLLADNGHVAIADENAIARRRYGSFRMRNVHYEWAKKLMRVAGAIFGALAKSRDLAVNRSACSVARPVIPKSFNDAKRHSRTIKVWDI
jgi:hypothetical protein